MDLIDASLDSLDDEGFIAIANELLEKCNLPDKVSRLDDCSDSFFVKVYKGLLGDDLHGITENPISVDQRVLNCQTVIDLVATDVLNVDLSHISGQGIIQGDKVSIRNFLEIFAGLLEYFMECVDDEVSNDEMDSNLLTSEHDIISGVLREEFGPSYPLLNEPRHSRNEAVGLGRSGGDTHSRSSTKPAATDSGLANTENSSDGFDADTSKLSDSRVDAVSDSTAELIRIGNISNDEASSNESRRKNTTQSASSSFAPQTHTSFKSDIGGSSKSDSRKPDFSSKCCDSTSPEDELTQYTLTPTASGHSVPTQKKGSPDKPSSSFLSGSSTSTAWPEQISPLEPSKDAICGGPGEFDGLGVRPKAPSTTGVTDNESRNSSGRSTPVYHHYHHHFHHMQEQGRVPDYPSAAEVCAAASVDEALPTNGLSRSEPAATRIAGSQRNRLIQTAPSVFTHPLMGNFQSSAAIPRSNAVSSNPTPLGVTLTTSTLTDSVFLSSSSSSRPPLLRPSTTTAISGASVTTSSVTDKMTRPTTATSSTVGSPLPTTSSLPLTSYGSYSATSHSLDERASVIERANILKTRLHNLRTGQPLASTFPGRSSDRPKIRITHLGDRTQPSVGEIKTDIEMAPEAEELAQTSDSAIDYGDVSSPTTPKMKADISTSRPKSLLGNRRKSPRTPRAYKSESTDEESSPERPPRRGVTFRDTVETFPVSGRMDQLRRLLYEEAEEERKRHTKDMRRTYQSQLKEIQQEQEKERALHYKRKMPLSPGSSKKKPKKKSPVKTSGRLQAVYRSQVRKYRPTRKTQTMGKQRKRSASASPVRNKRSTRMTASHPDHPDLLLPTMLEEFPFLHVSPQTAHSMWQIQERHLNSVLKPGTEVKTSKTQRMIEEAERRQEALVGILKKDLDHNLRMREKQEQQQQQRTVRAKLREKRQVSARARRYYDEYELRMRARMLKRRTREEQIFKKLFQDGLDIQKQRIRELREYAKEKREALAEKQQNEIESLENFYRDQFALLAEGIARERFEMEVREKAQEKVVLQMRKELRCKLERDVKEFQETLQRDEDSAYFRQLEADRLRGKFQLATRSAFY
ncbi:centrosomal protein of 95 kDa-like isoform X1 [Montipora foliosa]|uniref:centrosomal protein of 95 kDa-like isoform X1 n=1 Tax=Montipora foliosa TaxID=591990 RepID=UPI0035F1187F